MITDKIQLHLEITSTEIVNRILKDDDKSSIRQM